MTPIQYAEAKLHHANIELNRLEMYRGAILTHDRINAKIKLIEAKIAFLEACGGHEDFEQLQDELVARQAELSEHL